MLHIKTSDVDLFSTNTFNQYYSYLLFTLICNIPYLPSYSPIIYPSLEIPMSKKSQPQLRSKKRQQINMENGSQEETIKKPRKVVKRNKQVSRSQSSEQSSSPLNFYQTIQEIPTYYLSKQQMKQDPIQLLNRLQDKYSQFGAIKIAVNDAWNAPFTFRYVDKEVTTRIQCLQKLKQGKAFEQKVRAYRIQTYEAMAHAFSRQYRYKTHPEGRTQQSIREEEYWNLITNPQYEKKPVTVQYAADLSSSVYGSGFPTRKVSNWLDADFQYETNYFNLNNISKSPCSLLSICQKRKQKISGISYPWLYMGMMFSTFCWHVEDLFLNSLNYNHKGATKTWYIVPGSYKQKFDQFVQKKFEGNSKKKSILEKIVLMIDPKQLVKEGIKVYKVNQRSRQYVCTFYKAYHAGFSHGFNVGEAVNFLSARSLKCIQEGQKYYNQLQRLKDYKPKPLVLSKQWLIYENIIQNKIKSFSMEDQFKVKLEYRNMINHQQTYMKEQLIVKKKLSSINSTQKVHVIPETSKYEKLECSHCKNYIYLSAIECKICGILCQNHIDRCECESGKNNFQIWIRQLNKDRMKIFEQYPIILKAVKEFQTNKDKMEGNQSITRSKTQSKSFKLNNTKKAMDRSLSKAIIEKRKL